MTDKNIPAFPSSNEVSVGDYITTSGHAGMTLRDYFAAKALSLSGALGYDPKGTARWAYQMADAMMEERK